MSLRTRLASATAACLLSRGLQAQSQPGTDGPVGVWRGTSRCLVRPSPCNDELVVYRLSRVNAGDSVSLDGRKIVNGQELDMGVLGCRFTVASGQLTCAMPSGTWRFSVRGDSLVGGLTLPDGTKYRDVRAVRWR